MLGLLNAAAVRVEDRFMAMVESVRIGTVIAHDSKAANRWVTRRRRGSQSRRSAGLTGEALEVAVMQIGELYPGHVIREARHGAEP